MSKMKKSLLAASVLAVTAMGSGPVLAEISANVGVTSNYMWRGMTQTNDQAAISGGLDFEHESGFYVGTWASNVSWGGEEGDETGYELDVYGGFAGEIGEFGYDVGYIKYMYPSYDDENFHEFYVGGSYSVFSAMISRDPKNKNNYGQVGVDFDLPQGIGLGLHAGRYNYDGGFKVNDYAVTLSKDDFSFAVTNTNKNEELGQSDNYRVAVSWSKSF